MEALKGSGLENTSDDMFGGALKAFTLDIPEEAAAKAMAAFDTAGPAGHNPLGAWVIPIHLACPSPAAP